MKKWKSAVAALMIGSMCICGCSSGQSDNTESKTDYTSGVPWLCSILEGNVTEDTPTNLKNDFYLAVNKDALTKLEIPSDQSSAGFFDEGGQKLDNDFKAMFTEANPQTHDQQLAYDFYNLLMDWDTRNKIGIEPLTASIEQIEKIESLDMLTSHLVDSPIHFAQTSLWKFGPTIDFQDSTKKVGSIGTPDLLMEDSAEYDQMSERGSIRKEAKSTLVIKMLVKSGYSEKEAQAKIDNCLEMEKLLAKGILTTKEMNSPDYYSKIADHYTLDGIKEKTGAAPLVDYLQKKMGVSDHQEYVFLSPGYPDTLAEIYMEDNLDLIKDYLIVHNVLDMAGYLDRESYEWYWDCLNAISGRTSMKDDAINAANNVIEILPWPAAELYTAAYLKEEDKERITRFVESIIDAYHDILNNADFLSDEAKAAAIEKLEAISMRILYPDDWTPYNCDSLNFKGKEDGGSVVDALDAIQQYNVKSAVEELDKPVDPTKWDVPPTFFNCSYDPQTNSICIYGAFANAGFYRSDMTDEEMYAFLGFPTAHEITHAFDATGSQFDKNGNFNDWWSKEDREAFDAKNQKLIEYYDAIIPWNGEKYYGQVVCGEACADMGSMRCMLNLASQKENFDYDTFYRNIADQWLSKYKKETVIGNLTNVHPLDYLRVNCTLQQYQEFFDFYDIMEGDNMYLPPEDRVAIW